MRTWELPGSPDLVDLVAAARDAGHEVVLFERPMPEAISLAGIGRAFEIVAADGAAWVEDSESRVIDREDGPPLQAAANLWQRLAAGLQLQGRAASPAVGPVALGGFAFHPDRQPSSPWSGFPGLLFRVPRLALARVRGRTYATATDSPVAVAEELLELSQGFADRSQRRLEVEPARPAGDWMDAVAAAIARMRQGEAAKVVLARELIAHGDGPLSAGAVARRLRSAYPSCFTYLVGGGDGTAFVGASPELLVRRFGHTVTCQPMAGSVARGDDDAGDEQLAATLRGSAKNRAEHAVAAEAVAEALRPHSLSVSVPDGPEVVRFTNIQHLATTISAQLAEPPASLLQLAASLHPTPAVGGRPLPAALRLIDELEQLERGWYAGAVGWMDSRGDGELCVALRCGLLWEDGARLYAGNGIMPDSVPEQELQETELKLAALLGALASSRVMKKGRRVIW